MDSLKSTRSDIRVLSQWHLLDCDNIGRCILKCFVSKRPGHRVAVCQVTRKASSTPKNLHRKSFFLSLSKRQSPVKAWIDVVSYENFVSITAYVNQEYN